MTVCQPHNIIECVLHSFTMCLFHRVVDCLMQCLPHSNGPPYMGPLLALLLPLHPTSFPSKTVPLRLSSPPPPQHSKPLRLSIPPRHSTKCLLHCVTDYLQHCVTVSLLHSVTVCQVC